MAADLPGLLVDAAWLHANRADPRLRLFDATKYLPTEGEDGARRFADAHIPGARFFDIDLFADPETDLPHMVPSQGHFAALAGAAGIGPDSMVVFYDQKGQSSAARGWWLMRLFGHEAVALLDGGLPAWTAAGFALEAGAPASVPPSVFQPKLHVSLLAGLGDVLAATTDPTTVLLDARPHARFTGAAPEPRPGIAPGHIPSSHSLPTITVLDSTGRFLPPPALRVLFAATGITPDHRVIASCGTGVTAAILAAALHLAGLPDAAVYDGSWTEWGGRPDTPKETGP